MKSTICKTTLWNIQSDKRFQSRAGALDEATVEEYAERYREGLPMDPIQCVGRLHTTLFVVDGHHRFEAMKRAGLTGEVEVEIVSDSMATADIMWIAAASNIKHGLRRTKDDRENAVKMALQVYRDKDDAEIAEHCGVSRQLVGLVRKKHNLMRTEERAAIEETLPPPPPSTPPPPPADAPSTETTPPPPPPAQEAPAAAPSVPPPPPAKAAAAAAMPPPPPAHKISTVDRLLRPIPEPLREFFARRDEVRPVEVQLREIKAKLRAGMKNRDPLWCKIDNQTISALDNVLRTVEDCEPLYLCPECGGLAKDGGCHLCSNRGGFIGRWEYENIVKRNPTLLKYMNPNGESVDRPLPAAPEQPSGE